MTEFVAVLARRFDIEIQDPSLIETALTHRSFVKQYVGQNNFDNERLEFLGDAVLKMVVSADLYGQFSEAREGELTKRRARLISDAACAIYANSLNLDRYLRLSTSEEKSGGRERVSILGNAFEAILGAIYLDQCLEIAGKFLILVIEHSESVLSQEDSDHKTFLQELLQKQQLPLPVYSLLGTSGPDHQKIFNIQVSVTLKEGESLQEIGHGATKKEAEQQAAKKCLEHLKNDAL